MSSPPRPSQAVSLTVVLVAALAGCSHPPQGIDYVPPGALANVRLAAADVWSGGEVSVISSSFRTVTALPTVTVGGSIVTGRRVDDSTIAAQLPDIDAVLAVRVAVDSFLPFDASVTVHGYQQARDGPIMSGFVQAIPGQALVLGAGATGLLELNVRTNQVTRQWPDTVHSSDCAQGVGPSVQPGSFVFFGKVVGGPGTLGCDHPWVWQYGVTLVRTAASRADFNSWAIGEIGSGGVIFGGDHQLTMSHCIASVCTDADYRSAGGGFSLTGVTIAPLAHRAVLHSFRARVVNSQTGDTLFNLPLAAGAHLDGAAFSVNEDTTYYVAGPTINMASSAIGTLFKSATVSGANVVAVARDGFRPWIYVFLLANDRTPQLNIYSTTTLAPVATLRAPQSLVMTYEAWHQFRLVPDPLGARVYLVATQQITGAHTSLSKILTFGVAGP